MVLFVKIPISINMSYAKIQKKKPTHQKVADSLGIPNSTVAWRYARIRDYFKDCELPEDPEQQQRKTKAKTPKKRSSVKSKPVATSDSETEKLSGVDKASVQKKAPGYSLTFDADEGMADADLELDDDPQYVYKDNEDDYN